MSSNAKKRSASRDAISTQNLQEIEEAFSLFDPEKTDLINSKDLKVILRALGFEPRKDEIRRLTDEGDPENTGKIHKEQFINLVGPKLADKDSRAEITRAFRLFDDDETGRISFNNLKRVAKELGENITDQELKEMIDEADIHKAGDVSEDDFFRIMKKTCLY